jgi:threonine dehydrogenase-like Zn-dependent dehydrogenase
MMEKGLELRSGQTHVQRYTRDLLQRIERGEIDTTFLISPPPAARRSAQRLQELPRQAERVDKVVLQPH